MITTATRRALLEAQRALEGEVEVEAEILISQEGIPLWDAIEKAQEIVRQRRASKTRERS